MVKPSLKTSSFKHHPVYVQKSLHVDNPFYGPKPMYQRAEVITGGDCETVGDWAEDATGVWDVTASGDPRVGSESILMTQSGAVAASSIYLLLDGPVDLSWANYVGYWYKGKNAQTYAVDDIYFYIFTNSGNYVFTNAARYIDATPAYTEPGTAVWHYMELLLDDFTIASGYETDKLDTVWGVGFSTNTIATTETMNIDQIEFYSVGTGLGPARGLIESVPLYDDVHAIRGYGLAWNEYSGRVDISAQDDYAFAGICTGNPSRTKLSRDVTGGGAGVGDTTLYLMDPSLFETGVATIMELVTPATEAVTITAVDKVSRTITVSTGITAATFTTARNAFVCMEGNEEGTIRVDVLVDGIVNVTADEIVNQGYGAKCEGVGSAFTVFEDNANDEGRTIGKCMITCADEEDFPVRLMTDARTA
jgi:hypothetical protein